MNWELLVQGISYFAILNNLQINSKVAFQY